MRMMIGFSCENSPCIPWTLTRALPPGFSGWGIFKFFSAVEALAAVIHLLDLGAGHGAILVVTWCDHVLRHVNILGTKSIEIP